MKEKAIRFGITNKEEKRSATWKLWVDETVRGPEIYLLCRELGDKLKASLHKSGQWHIAYSQQTYETDVKNSSIEKEGRFISKWSKPEVLATGMTLAFRVVTPYSAIISPIGKSNSKVTWIQNISAPKAVEIDIFLVSSSVKVSGWPGKNSMNTSLVGKLDLDNGDMVWTVSRLVEMPDLSKACRGEGKFHRGRGPENLNTDNLRALVLGREKDGSRVFYDCIVRNREEIGFA